LRDSAGQAFILLGIGTLLFEWRDWRDRRRRGADQTRWSRRNSALSRIAAVICLAPGIAAVAIGVQVLADHE
jgi:hypothetical protein